MKRDAHTIQKCLQALSDHGGNKTLASESIGMTRTTFRRYIDAVIEDDVEVDDGLIHPEFPPEDLPIEQVIKERSRRFETRQRSYDAHTWFKVGVKDTKPIGICWFGDPHLDDNGTAWPILLKDIETCKNTEGLYGANIGDTTNNWQGRLVKLYANQDTSVKTARRLAKWFMLDCGVDWLVWLLGNHDQWGDGSAILSEMGAQKIVCHDWEARFKIAFPNGEEFKIWAAHDFKGHSMWNPLHGPSRASQMKAEADIYVCGHKHNWGLMKWENAERGMTPDIIRVRGYKFLDEYARNLGITEQKAGCAVMTILDPYAKTAAGRVRTELDIEAGADYLTYLRNKHD